jgi:hypothetical protein
MSQFAITRGMTFWKVVENAARVMVGVNEWCKVGISGMVGCEVAWWAVMVWLSPDQAMRSGFGRTCHHL